MIIPPLDFPKNNPSPEVDKKTETNLDLLAKRSLEEAHSGNVAKKQKFSSSRQSLLDLFAFPCPFSFEKAKFLIQEHLEIDWYKEIDSVYPSYLPTPPISTQAIVDETRLAKDYEDVDTEESSVDSETYELLYNDLEVNFPQAQKLLAKFYENVPELKSEKNCEGALALTALLIASKLESDETDCNNRFYEFYCSSLNITLSQLCKMERAFLILSEYKGFNLDMENPKPSILLWKELIKTGAKTTRYTYEQYLIDEAKTPEERADAVSRAKITSTFADRNGAVSYVHP